MSGWSSRRRVWRYGPTGWAEIERAAPEEAPVAFLAKGQPFAAVMASPADLEDLARGFAVTERMVRAAGEIGGVQIRAVDEGFEAAIDIPPARAEALADRRRAFAARTSCSLCGLEDLDALLAAEPVPVGPIRPLTPQAMLAGMADLPARQRLNAETKSAHAAGWIDATGALTLVREDVGRHNALDKLVGAMLTSGVDPAEGALALTSRCSIEMVLKAAAAGVSQIVAASSPTELAVRAAEAAGIVLAAGARDGAFDLYAGAERLQPRSRPAISL